MTKGLLEEIRYRKIFKYWVNSDIFVAIFSISGFFVAFYYHIAAIYEIRYVCMEIGTSHDTCQKRLNEDRFPETDIFKWIIIGLSIPSVFFFFFG